jgi:hypothetical protein
MKSTDFIVARHDFQQCRFIETATPDAAQLPEGALLIEVNRFAFTANNVTYALLGDELKYWGAVSGAGWFRQHPGVGLWRGNRLAAS